MKAEFEEKTYENYFNAELDSKSSIYFPFGQIQEGVIGLDSASNTRNRRLWRALGYPFWFHPHFPGVDLKEVAEEMQRYLGEVINHIPHMKVNLLFQYKRPQFIVSGLGKEWNHWEQSYYRYNIYQKQHKLLVELDKTFGAQALTIYAAPAIYKIDDLVELKKRKQIIEYSNFRKASELTGHKRNTYTRAGNFSIACSEPEKIENFNLIEFIGSQQQNNNLTNKEFIFQTQEKALQALSYDKNTIKHLSI